MPTSVLLILSTLLILAGAVSIAAAAMGNPIRIGSKRFPGPESAVERAVIGVVGAVCVAAIIPAFIVGGNGADAGTTPLSVHEPELAVLPSVPISPTPGTTTTPEPPAGPSTAAAVPGKPTVTSIFVTGSTTNGCARLFTATVRVSNDPVTVRYRTYVDGVLVGPATRTKTVSGAGSHALDPITVTATHSGAVKVRYDVVGPNPTLLTGSTSWVAPAACQPTGPAPATSATPPANPPTLSVSTTASPNSYTGSCDATQPSFQVTGSVSVGVGSLASVPINWTFTVQGAAGSTSGQVTALLGVGTSLPTQIVTLTDTTTADQTITVLFSATSPDTQISSTPLAQPITVHCTVAQPPPG